MAPDPTLVTGRLDNGLRYVIKPNLEPKNRVVMQLLVGVGSLMEDDKERGLAHFLEHLVFKGTESFAPGSLIDLFKEMGMDFGSDSNAYTTFDRTVYHLMLPAADTTTLDRGLQILTELGFRALLRPEDVEVERGVILAEKRSRDSASYRTQVASSSFAFAGTRLPSRFVIGDEKVLQTISPEEITDFYRRWYRPENLTLAIVGDLNPEELVPLIVERFSNASNAGAQPRCPEFGTLQKRGEHFFYHHEPELGKTTISLETIRDLIPEPDSSQVATKELQQLLATIMINERLQRLEEEGVSGYSDAYYSSDDLLSHIGISSLAAQTEAASWLAGMEVLTGVLSQVLQHGFAESELKLAKVKLDHYLEQAILTEKSEDSRQIVTRLVDHLANNRVFQSRTQEQLRYHPLLAAQSAQSVTEATRTAWRNGIHLVSVTGTASLGDTPQVMIQQSYQRGLAQQTTPWRPPVGKVFPYLAMPQEPAILPETTRYPELQVDRFQLSNGLTLFIKSSDFDANEIRVVASFGRGDSGDHPPEMILLASHVVGESGTGTLLRSELEEVLAGTSVQVDFASEENAFTWRGRALVKDFDLLVQVLYTVIMDPGWHESVFDKAKERLRLMYQRLEHQVEGAMPLHVAPYFAGGQQSFGLPPWENVAKVSYQQFSRWADKNLRATDLEVAAVGDLPVKEIAAVLTSSLGQMKLAGGADNATQSINFPQGGRLDLKVATEVDKSLVIIGWPTADFWDISRTRRLHLLAGVLEERLLKTLREKMGATYSPSVASLHSRAHQGFGYVMAQITTTPGKEQVVASIVLELGEQLAREGLLAAEVERVKNPVMTGLQESLKSNGYWLNNVIHLAGRFPQQLSWPTTIVGDYGAANKEELDNLARSFLIMKNAAVVTVSPVKGASALAVEETELAGKGEITDGGG